MTESILISVIDKLLSMLVEEAKLFKSAHGEVNNLKNELELIYSLFKDADTRWEKREMSEMLRTWLKQLREVAYLIEDVMDEYLLHAAQHRHLQHGFISFPRKIAHLIRDLKPRYNISTQIQSIQASLHEIKERSVRYGLRPLEQGVHRGVTNVQQYDPRLSSLFVEETELVGIDSTRDDLVRRLVGGASARTVISLVGEGGIGKTTLVKMVYDKEEVKTGFDFHAWINVSQSYNIVKLLRSMTMQICPAATECIVGEMDALHKLITLLRQHLHTKRYVVVFDDVWDLHIWEVMRHAMPSNSKGSRIIITTRNNAIATSCKGTSCDFILKLQPLSQEMAWELFCKKAFRYELEGRCPPELEPLSLEIVMKCKGLPLVVATVAALLSTKEKIVSEWQELHDSLKLEIGANPHLSNISKILSLSYDDLPYHLKPCFLYFGIFPEDYYINNSRLYRLWIAEGFVQEKRGETLDQVAEEYLNELIHRNLIQTSVNNYSPIKKCGVHDLMREIILSRADELRFCQCVGQHKNNSRSWGTYRRLSIYNSTKHVSENVVEDFRGVRSIFLFNIDQLEEYVILFEKFKLLKVLDFTDAPLCHLPEQVGRLLHLKYLCLRNTKIKMLPKSIGKLHNLQALDIRETCVVVLPNEINKLINLQYILAFTYYHDWPSTEVVQGVKIRKGFGCLKNLQTLAAVDAYGSGISVIKELEKLRHLRWLIITKMSAECGRTLCAVIEKLDHLELLSLNSISKDEYLDVQHISSPPRLLRHLLLIGQLQKLPDWIAKLQNLRSLSFNCSRLGDDLLKFLKDLPNLEFLDMYQAYEGEKLHFEKGFQKLKQLSLKNLKGIKVLKIEEGALPLLKNLFVGPSPLLKEVPLDIGLRLTKLEVLKFFDMPKDFVLGMQPKGGRDYWKVEHVGCVIFGYSLTGQQHKPYRLGKSDVQHYKYYKLGLGDDPLKFVKDLPDFKILDVYQAYEGERLHFDGGFHRLKQHCVGNLEGLTVLEVEEVALPLLKHLFIGPSLLMKVVPLDIQQRLRKLPVQKSFDMPKDFVLGVQPAGGRDYWNVKHVECVIFGYKFKGQHYKFYEVGESNLLERLHYTM